MIPILTYPADAQRVDSLIARLRLDARMLALEDGPLGAASASVRKIVEDVARRGDAALVDIARKFDDPQFSPDEILVTPMEMIDAAERITEDERAAIKRSIAQVTQYQRHFMPKAPEPLVREGVELAMRFTPLDSAGLHVPGGKAAYPSSLIMLAVPAKVAGVGRIVVCTPPSRHGRSDIMLATFHELGLTHVYRAGGAGAIAAMAFGTETIPAVDKVVGPGNIYTQLAKRLLAGAVGIDGFLGPSEILTIADETGRPEFIAADLLAQAEHDPGYCFLLTTRRAVADEVVAEIESQLASRARADAIRASLANGSAVIVDDSMARLVELANRFAAEHVNLQTRDNAQTLSRLNHAGAVFIGPYSPVAAGDYVAGPSHCLPTNTTARFSSGVSCYEFLKRSSVVEYQPNGLRADAPHIIALAAAEHLDAHAASVAIREAATRANG